MTHYPPPSIFERRRKVLRGLGIALSVLMVLLVVTVLILRIRHGRAHEETVCPFKSWSERAFDGGKVYEETRTCVEGITERRYRVARDGQGAFELARKQLASDRFDSERYRWELSTDQEKRLVLKIYVDDKLLSESREEDAVEQ